MLLKHHGRGTMGRQVFELGRGKRGIKINKKRVWRPNLNSNAGCCG